VTTSNTAVAGPTEDSELMTVRDLCLSSTVHSVVVPSVDSEVSDSSADDGGSGKSSGCTLGSGVGGLGSGSGTGSGSTSGSGSGSGTGNGSGSGTGSGSGSGSGTTTSGS
jgi:hypothetical protein